MDEEEQARKLALIARLTEQEILGWEWALSKGFRAPFPGEKAALLQRKTETTKRNQK